MNQKIRILFLILFSIVSGGLILYFAVDRPVVYVLHSYNTDYEWVQDVNQAFRERLQDKSYYRIHYHYMDTKNNPSSTFRKKAALQARQMIDNLNPDVVVIFDDNAQDSVGRFLVDTSYGVIYAGVNAEPESYGYIQKGQQAQNVTGITEVIPLDVIQDLIQFNIEQKVLPQNPRIAHLADASASVSLDDKTIQNLPRYSLSKLVPSFSDWKAAIDTAHTYCDLLLISNYRNVFDDNGMRVPEKKLIAYARTHAQVPLLGINGFVVSDGADIAVATSPYEQGRRAAEKLIQLLDHEKQAGEIPAEKAQEVLVYIRAPENAQKGGQRPSLTYPPVFEAFARATDNFLTMGSE